MFSNAESAQSIRNELDLNEKDRPTTTEVTAKSVNRNNQWWFEDDTTDAGDNMNHATHEKDYFPIAELAAKSVSWSVVSWFEADSRDALDTMIDLSYENYFTSIGTAGSIR